MCACVRACVCVCVCVIRAEGCVEVMFVNTHTDTFESPETSNMSSLSHSVCVCVCVCVLIVGLDRLMAATEKAAFTSERFSAALSSRPTAQAACSDQNPAARVSTSLQQRQRQNFTFH